MPFGQAYSLSGQEFQQENSLWMICMPHINKDCLQLWHNTSAISQQQHHQLSAASHQLWWLVYHNLHLCCSCFNWSLNALHIYQDINTISGKKLWYIPCCLNGVDYEQDGWDTEPNEDSSVAVLAPSLSNVASASLQYATDKKLCPEQQDELEAFLQVCASLTYFCPSV